MRQLLLLLLLGGMTLPTFAAKRITVEQLEQTLAAGHGKSDAELARQLSDIELTERLDDAKLTRWQAELPGTEAKQALLLLADASAFLDLPPAEIPSAPAPDFAAQRRMIALAISYVGHTLRQLPNFSATRLTLGFQDTPQGYGHGGLVFEPAQPMHFAAQSSATVLYRDGSEVVDVTAEKGKKTEAAPGLTSSGEFGPILVNMLVDAAHGKLAWSHWEPGSSAALAVFRFSVPREQSHYEVAYCCIANPGTSFAEVSPFRQVAAYHGEFALDPATGVVFRVTLKADLKTTDPIVRADMLVDYGPVEIGGRSYICPVKSVSISLAEATNALELQRYRRAAIASSSVQYAPGHLQTRLNDVSFTQYHLFRADARLVAENSESPGPDQAPSAPAAASPAPVDTPAASTSTASVAPDSDRPPPVTPPEASPQPAVAPTASPTPTEADFTPPFASPGSSVPLFKANTEAVVVDVVVTKANGDAVLNLGKENFQVIEDGKPQAVDLFEEHTGESAPATALPPMPANVFTNQPAAPPGNSVNVLLLDSLNTPPPDQAFVHQQILNFLKNVQPGTRIAIFALGSKLRFIQGFSDGPALLRAALNDKNLGARPDTSPASRTRQDDVDDAEHIKTMEMMNGGHMTAGIEAVQQAQADFAAQQGGEAVQMTLAALRHLALYLAGVPGRKNLIWFSSTFPVTVYPSEKEKNLPAAQRTYAQQIRDTADLLTSSKVAIYPVGAEGMAMNHTVEMQADMAEAVKTGPMGEKSNQMTDNGDQNSARAASLQAMEQLASGTGGEAIFNTNDLNKAIARVIQNGSHYYTLVYTPANKTMDGKYRRIEVKLNGGKYKLAYRRGYYADQPARSEPVDEDSADFDPLRPLLAYGMPSATQLLYGVRVLPALPQPDAGAGRAGGNTALTAPVTRYTVDFMVRWTDVDMDTTAKGTHAGKIQAGVIAYDRDGKALNWIGTKQLMNLNETTYAAIQRSGIPVSLQIDVPPGAYYLATGIYDWGSKKAGTLQVPLTSLSPPVSARLETSQKK
jgi:VWFA-related protein